MVRPMGVFRFRRGTIRACCRSPLEMECGRRTRATAIIGVLVLCASCTAARPTSSLSPPAASETPPGAPETQSSSQAPQARGERSQRQVQFARGWTDLPAPPDARRAVVEWTGGELLVWSGYVYTGYSNEEPIDGGYALDPKTGKVNDLPPAPIQPRVLAASAWSGHELLVWGGYDLDCCKPSSLFADGAAYDPVTGAWRTLPEAPISARAPLSVWTGKELLVVGTQLRTKDVAMDGAAYDPAKDEWRRIKEAPVRLTDATAVWTGEQMVIFGAALQGGNHARTDYGIGAAFDPKRNTWRELPVSKLSPQASTAAWDGKEMIAWDYNNRSQAFDPRTWTWRQLPKVPVDSGECVPIAVAIGRAVFGDYCGNEVLYAHGTWRHEESPTLFAYRQRLIDKGKDVSGPVLYDAGDAVLVIVGRQKKDEWIMASFRA